MAADPETLRANRHFQDVPATALEHLASRSREGRFGPGERMIERVDPAPEMSILLEGLAKLVGVTVDGDERIIYMYHPGEIYGEQFLIEESGIEDYELVAMTPVRAVTFGIVDFLKVGVDHPALLVGVTRALCLRLDKMNDRLMAAMSDDARIRLSQLLLDFAEDGPHPRREFVPLRYSLTHESMGQIIGATRPHTTMVLKALEEEGAVRRQGQKGLLVRPSRLGEIISRRAHELVREHEDDEAWDWPRPMMPPRERP